MKKARIKPGNLVKITRASLGIPKNTLALVTGEYMVMYNSFLFAVRPLGNQDIHRSLRGRVRRYHEIDLELVS